MTQRMYVVPDLGNDLTSALGLVALALAQLAGRLEDPRSPSWPAPLGDRSAVDALDRVFTAVRRTQGVGWKRWLAPDGHTEHVPLRFIFLREEDLVALAAAATELSRALGVLRLRNELKGAADAAGTTPLELVSTLRQVHGLLDLPLTADAQLLHEVSVRARDGSSRHRSGTGDLVLKRHEEAAYQATAGLLNTRWALAKPPTSAATGEQKNVRVQRRRH